MATQYTPRRAGRKWTENAPDFVFDCFDEPGFHDRYTVFLGADHLIRVDENTVIVPFIASSESGGTYFGEIDGRQLARYRYTRKHRRIAWQDLPETVKRAVQNRLAADT